MQIVVWILGMWSYFYFEGLDGVYFLEFYQFFKGVFQIILFFVLYKFFFLFLGELVERRYRNIKIQRVYFIKSEQIWKFERYYERGYWEFKKIFVKFIGFF